MRGKRNFFYLEGGRRERGIEMLLYWKSMLNWFLKEKVRYACLELWKEAGAKADIAKEE